MFISFCEVGIKNLQMVSLVFVEGQNFGLSQK